VVLLDLFKYADECMHMLAAAVAPGFVEGIRDRIASAEIAPGPQLARVNSIAGASTSLFDYGH
jgi:hypothetical protein